MRTEGADFLQRNSALAEEVRRTFVDLDEVERELKKAAKAIETVSMMTAKLQGTAAGTLRYRRSDQDRPKVGTWRQHCGGA